MTAARPIRVLIVGGGPAGLTAATELARHLGDGVVVIEREAEAGGIPRHSNHPGYGLRDRRRVLNGPAYAARLVSEATRAGADVRTGAMVTGWDDDGRALVTSPTGRFVIEAEAIVLATGARERPRPARLIAGDRPAGVLTTGQLQDLVHVHHASPGTRAVVVGGELVSWSAVLTLREAGARTVLMTTSHRAPESYAAVNLAGRYGLRVRLATRTRVVRIIGRGRVEAVVTESLDTGARRVVDCDTVVFTGDWIPDNEVARAGGLELDPVSLAPLVDTALRTTRAGVFAAGNLLHPVDTADIAALDGRHVAGQVLDWLGGRRPTEQALHVRAEAPLRWIAPALLRRDDPAPARHRLISWTDAHIAHPALIAWQDGRVIGHRRVPWPAAPGRAFRIPSSLLAAADLDGPDVTITCR